MNYRTQDMAQNSQLAMAVLFLCLEKTLEHTMQSLNSCSTDKWLHEWMNKLGIPNSSELLFLTWAKILSPLGSTSISSYTHIFSLTSVGFRAKLPVLESWLLFTVFGATHINSQFCFLNYKLVLNNKVSIRIKRVNTKTSLLDWLPTVSIQ